MKIATFIVGGLAILAGLVYALKGEKTRLTGVGMMGTGALLITFGLLGNL